MLNQTNLNRPAILIVDDESEVREVVGEALSESYRIMFAKNGDDAIDIAKKTKPDLIVLDLLMPGKDGFSVCRTLRENFSTNRTPIVILSAKNDPLNRIEALRAGADDFVGKPFHPEELLIRVTKRLKVDTKPVGVVGLFPELGLREIEFKIFRALLSRDGKVITRDELCGEVWGKKTGITDRNLDPHISSLRKKLKKTAFVVKTAYGNGYCLKER